MLGVAVGGVLGVQVVENGDLLVRHLLPLAVVQTEERGVGFRVHIALNAAGVLVAVDVVVAHVAEAGVGDIPAHVRLGIAVARAPIGALFRKVRLVLRLHIADVLALPEVVRVRCGIAPRPVLLRPAAAEHAPAGGLIANIAVRRRCERKALLHARLPRPGRHRKSGQRRIFRQREIDGGACPRSRLRQQAQQRISLYLRPSRAADGPALPVYLLCPGECALVRRAPALRLCALLRRLLRCCPRRRALRQRAVRADGPALPVKLPRPFQRCFQVHTFPLLYLPASSAPARSSNCLAVICPFCRIISRRLT